jgi:hypothetical protein
MYQPFGRQVRSMRDFATAMRTVDRDSGRLALRPK